MHQLNASECRLDYVLHRVTDERILDGWPDLTLRTVNQVLQFFAWNSPMIPQITEAYLLDLKRLAAEHPLDWDRRARAEFRPYARAMRIPHVPTIEPRRTGPRNTILHGNFLDHVASISDASVDLLVTSPPYAMQRKRQYGGIREHDYPGWTSEWMSQVRRILKTGGSVPLIIRPHVRDGRVSPYVRYMAEWLEQDGWYHHDDLIWLKTDGPPMGRTDWLRRSYEFVLWFSLSERPFCNPRAAGQATDRIGSMQSRKGLRDYINQGSVTPSRSGISRAPDVIVTSVSRNDRAEYNRHPAQFPQPLVEALIRTFCPPRGFVLDPFVGRGTTALAAMATGRNFLGVERVSGYVNMARLAIKEARP